MPILIHSLVASLPFLMQHTELPSPFSRGTVFESTPKMSGLTPLYWTPAGYRPIWATGLRKGGAWSQHLTLLKSLQAVWLMWLPMEPRSSTVARSSSTTAKFKNGRLLGWFFLSLVIQWLAYKKLEVVNICSLCILGNPLGSKKLENEKEMPVSSFLRRLCHTGKRRK
jgi:hypothetical protein